MLVVSGDAFLLSTILQWIGDDESLDHYNLNGTAARITIVELVLAWCLAPIGVWMAMPMFLAAAAIVKHRCEVAWTTALFAAQVLVAIQFGVWLFILRGVGLLP